MKDGKVTAIEGDPESPINRGSVCEKGIYSFHMLYHPERLKAPLKREGKRGSGKWKEIDWNEALKEIARGLEYVKRKYGSESVAFIHGAAKGLQDVFLRRLANVFGSPNIASMGHVCFLPVKYGHITTFGYLPCTDPNINSRCIVVWGMRKPKIFEFERILDEKRKGSKLIIIDPLESELTEAADIWIRIRPGSDLALALSMIHVIIKEELFDRNFVENWTTGFKELAAHVKRFSPEWAQTVTWVEKGKILEASRTYAKEKPSVIKVGNAIEHTPSGFQTSRAIAILKALTGNLSVPGGEVYRKPIPIRGRYDPVISLEDALPEHKRDLRLGKEKGFSPFYTFSHPPTLIEAMLTGKPYPVRAAYIQGANPLLTYPNSRKVLKALLSLDFLVTVDLFMTPTAFFSDIVLPSATFFEFDSVVAPPYYPMAQAQVKVTGVRGCWSDFKIINSLSEMMGLGEFFFKNEREFLDLVLEPSGMDFESFIRNPYMEGDINYYHYKSKGFETPSGKVELFSRYLEELGYDPLPTWREKMEEDAPFIMTSRKSPYFRHSQGRHIKPLRYLHREPMVTINKESAKELGIEEGDTVKIRTPLGSIVQRAKLSERIHPKVVELDYAWWFPEDGPEKIFSWDTSNINVLIEDGPPYGKELGTVRLRGIGCWIEKAKD